MHDDNQPYDDGYGDNDQPFNGDAQRAALHLLVSDLAEEDPEALKAAIGRMTADTRTHPEDSIFKQAADQAARIAFQHLASLGQGEGLANEIDEDIENIIYANAGFRTLLQLLGASPEIYQAARNIYLHHDADSYEAKICRAVMDQTCNSTIALNDNRALVRRVAKKYGAAGLQQMLDAIQERNNL